MSDVDLTSFDKLTIASFLLTKETSLDSISTIVVEQTIDNTKSDVASLYMYPDHEKNSNLKLAYKRGNYIVPEEFDDKSELVEFIKDCFETLVLLERKKSPFIDILLNEKMESGVVLPLSTQGTFFGILILNSLKKDFYDRSKIAFLESFAKIAGGIFDNFRLHKFEKRSLQIK